MDDEKILILEATVLDKVRYIHNIYEKFYSEERFFEKFVCNSEDMEVHYLYDITDTLLNTLGILESSRGLIGMKCSKEEHILMNIGLMQLAYVHQDLVDELLTIFKIENSQTAIKRKNIRLARNELVGHPICRDNKGKLISTAVWDWSDEHKTIQYLRRPNGQVRGQIKKEINLDSFINEHEAYLNESLDLILKRQQKALREYKKKLQNVVSLIENERTTEVIKTTVDSVYGIVQRASKYDGYFSKGNLEIALEKYTISNRYSHFIEYYLYGLTESWHEYDPSTEISEIEKLLNGHIEKIDYSNIELPEIVFIDDVDEFDDGSEIIVSRGSEKTNIAAKPSYENLREKYNYYLSKLSEKRFLEDIHFLRSELLDYDEIVTELDHMESNWSEEKYDYGSNVEYYSALLYLNRILEDIPA